MKMSEFLRYLDIPTEGRDREFPCPQELRAYHITEIDNLSGIKAAGLVAKPCTHGFVTRRPAVYFFLERHEITTSIISILGIKNPAIVEVVLTAENIRGKLEWDGPFNVAFYTRSAVQYLGDVPPQQIVSTDVLSVS